MKRERKEPKPAFWWAYYNHAGELYEVDAVLYDADKVAVAIIPRAKLVAHTRLKKLCEELLKEIVGREEIHRNTQEIVWKITAELERQKGK